MAFRNRTWAALFFAALFFTGATSAQVRPDFNRKQAYDVQHYLIRTSFDRAKFEVIGDTTITLKPLAANLTTVEFDQVGLNFKTVVLDPAGTPLKFRTTPGKVAITLDKAYGPNDTVGVRLTYTATKPTKGIYFVEPLIENGVEKRSAQVWSQGEADENRHWFPSFDFPSDKATSEQFITAEKENTVVANGELLEQKENADGTITWHFRMPVPHSSYLISLVVGKYAKVSEKYKDVSLGYFVYPGTEQIVPKAYGKTKEMVRIYEELTGVPFPYNKYDQTIVSSFVFGGMENITATTMADTEIFGANVEFMRGNVEDLVSHELAHSWFGDLVTCRNWAELWLNEGFATFMEAAYREKMYGRKDYLRMVASDAEEFMIEDAVLPKNHGLFNLDAANVPALFDHSGVTYSKGGAVIHTLREQVGDANFWKAINIYLNRHKFANVESTDLRKVMEETSGQDLGWFFDQWVYGVGYPKMTATPVWNPAKKVLTVTVTQIQKPARLVASAFRLPMDINIDYGAVSSATDGDTLRNVEVNKRTQVFTFQLPRKPKAIHFDPSLKIPLKSVKIMPIV